MKSRWWGGLGLASRKRELKSSIVRFLQPKGSDSEHQIHLCQPFVLYYHSRMSLNSPREITDCLYNVCTEYIDKNIYSVMRSVHGCRQFELIIKLFAFYGLKKRPWKYGLSRNVLQLFENDSEFKYIRTVVLVIRILVISERALLGQFKLKPHAAAPAIRIRCSIKRQVEILP